MSHYVIDTDCGGTNPCIHCRHLTFLSRLNLNLCRKMQKASESIRKHQKARICVLKATWASHCSHCSLRLVLMLCLLGESRRNDLRSPPLIEIDSVSHMDMWTSHGYHDISFTVRNSSLRSHPFCTIKVARHLLHRTSWSLHLTSTIQDRCQDRCQEAESKKQFQVFQVLSGAVGFGSLCASSKHRFEAMIKLERRLSVAFSRSKGSWICSCHSFHTFMYFLTFCLSFPPLSFESHFLAFGFATLQPSCAFMKPQFLAGSRDPEISLGIIRYFLICIGFGTHLQSLLLCSC